MSTSRYVEINCDAQLSSDCHETIGPEPSTAAVKAEARRNGWHLGRRGEPDICPPCWVVVLSYPAATWIAGRKT